MVLGEFNAVFHYFLHKRLEDSEVAILLVRVPVATVSIDERFPDRDDSFVLEHLRYYCARFDPLPAITIVVEGDRTAVVRGRKYLLVARELGRSAIRAVVASSPESDDVRALLARDDVTILDWARIQEEERLEPMPHAWHVFFLERALTPAEKMIFDSRVLSLFSGFEKAVPVIHDDSGPLAEFQARTPVTDQAWAAKHLEVFAAFSREHVRIVSYQGRKFGNPKAESG
jgi:hypothetical protein